MQLTTLFCLLRWHHLLAFLGWLVVHGIGVLQLFVLVSSAASESDPPPQASDLIWQCFTAAEVPFFKRLFKKMDTSQSLVKLDSELSQILKSENSIQFVEELE